MDNKLTTHQIKVFSGTMRQSESVTHTSRVYRIGAALTLAERDAWRRFYYQPPRPARHEQTVLGRFIDYAVGRSLQKTQPPLEGRNVWTGIAANNVPSLWATTLTDPDFNQTVQYLTGLNPLFLTTIDQFRSMGNFENALEAFDHSINGREIVNQIRVVAMDHLDCQRSAEYIKLMTRTLLHDARMDVNTSLVDDRFFVYDDKTGQLSSISGHVTRVWTRIMAALVVPRVLCRVRVSISHYSQSY